MINLQQHKISVENAGYYHSTYRYNSVSKLQNTGKMHGARRVATFCILTAVLPTLLIIIPLYLRHSLFADVLYQVAESDVIEIREGISSIFCQEHVLSMNSSFNAYQLSHLPEISNNRKNIKLKKVMHLPDDTLEYWGFYLLKGATVALKVCSRYEGSRILVVRGERNLRTCGLLEHNKNKLGPHLDKEYKQVHVTFETAAQDILSEKDMIKSTNKSVIYEDLNTGSEEIDEDEEVEELRKQAENFIKKHRETVKKNCDDDVEQNPNCAPEKTDFPHGKRHGKKRQQEKDEILKLQEELNENGKEREKRETGHKLDGAIGHGGNAINYTEVPSEESSISSFETNLLTCYDGQILLTQGFSPNKLCSDVNYLETGDHMQMLHDISSDGYYYYIFYSDNDLVSNDIYAVFDILKPTYQYTNISSSKQCINHTECTFAVSFFSDETVIVEIPTRDGIEHEEEDVTLLVSVCKPRMAIYIIFPITILFLILGCAFL